MIEELNKERCSQDTQDLIVINFLSLLASPSSTDDRGTVQSSEVPDRDKKKLAIASFCAVMNK